MIWFKGAITILVLIGYVALFQDIQKSSKEN